jgi:POT family proton-dependent oligopeptide transporter
MRSFVQAFYLFTSAASAALGVAFLPHSENPLLIWSYGSMAVIAFVAGCLFYFKYEGLDKAEGRLNMLPTGHVGAKTPTDAETELKMD